MAYIVMPFLMSMLLGRTIDLRTYRIGGDVFDNQAYDVRKLTLLTTSYIVLQDNNLPYSQMGLPLDIVLRIKSGILDAYSGAMGLDGLLRDSSWKVRSAAVIVATNVKTVQRTLKEDAKPIPNWTTRISKDQTHYANSIMYGEWSFIIYQFKCEIPWDVEVVRDTLIKNLGTHGKFGPKFVESWEKATRAVLESRDIRGNVEILTHHYSTFPIKHDVSLPENVLKLKKEIPSLVGTKGKPLYMELLPLHKLDPKYPAVYENHTLDSKLGQLDSMYDDVKNTKDSILSWMAKTDKSFSEEQESEISDLVDHLSACLQKFHAIASDASIYKKMDLTLLNDAFSLYQMGLTKFTNNYERIYRKMKEKIDADCEDEFIHPVKGLLDVDDTEKKKIGFVGGGRDECMTACLALPECRSIGYIDRMALLERVKHESKAIFNVVTKRQICYAYLRSSSTANVVPVVGYGVAGGFAEVYDRRCS